VNLVETYLTRHHAELQLERYGLPGALSTVLVLPRFDASRHVVFLILPRGVDRPALVAKMPRRRGDDSGVRHEAEMLDRLATLAPDLAGTVPQLVASDIVEGECLVVESFVAGLPLSPWQVKQDVEGSIEAGIQWLTRLPRVGTTADEPGWFRRLVEEPLHRFGALQALGAEGEQLVETTLQALAPLQQTELPMYFEHGDVSHPNVLRIEDGRLAVLDWERAEPRGLPLHDLCFFLAFIGFARESSFDLTTQVRAFDAAFIGTEAWARPHLRRQLAALQLAPDLAPLLLLATFARSGAGLVDRMWGQAPPCNGGCAPVGADGGDGNAMCATDVRDLVFTDRDVVLWRRAVERQTAGATSASGR
jgi:Phosphotransferase enzyme family